MKRTGMSRNNNVLILKSRFGFVIMNLIERKTDERMNYVKLTVMSIIMNFLCRTTKLGSKKFPYLYGKLW
jgi:hypothetical protein